MNKLLDPPGIHRTVMQLACTSCGQEAIGSCNCGVAYMPKRALAEQYAREHPGASVRKISEETGASHGTAQRAKQSVPTGTRSDGRDGKTYPATKPEPPLERDPAGAIVEQIITLFRQLDFDDRSKVLDEIDQIYG